jgi:hypothetical protein
VGLKKVRPWRELLHIDGSSLRSLLKGKYSSEGMLEYLKQMPPESLASGGTAAYARRGGGRKLANDMIANLEEEGEVSLSKLQKLILSEV